MASVTGNGSKGHHSFTLEVTEVANSQNLENNTSDISFTFKIAPRTSGYNWSGWGNKISYKVTIDGTEYSGTIPSYNGSSTVTLKSGTQTIRHADNGTKTVAFSFSVSDSTGQNYTCGSASGSSSLTLSQIPRASTISSIIGNQIGSSITVAINKADSSFTHKLQVIYGDKRTDWIDFGSASSKSITVPMDFCNSQYLRNTDNGQCIFWLITQSNGTTIGDSQYLYTMYVPSSVVPIINSVTKSDTSVAPPGNVGSNYDKHGAYVQGKSNLRIQTSSNGAYSSTITNTSVTIKKNTTVLRTLTGNDVTISNINYTGTITIIATVTDSRGRTATNSSTITVATYENPKINSFTAERLSNDSTVTLKWNASITNINSHNSNGKTFKIYAREKGTSGWGTAIYTYTSDYSYTSNGTTITKDANKSWEFKLDAIDSYATTSKIIEVGTAFDLVNYGPNGTTIAFGKVADTNKSNAFECDLDMYAKHISISNFTNEKSTIIAQRTDNGNSIEFGIGIGGVNRGIFDGVLNKWLFHTDGTDIYVDGKKVSDYMYDSGWVNCTTSQGTWSYCQVRRIGKVVHLRGYATSLGCPSGMIFTIPSGYRPSQSENAFGQAGWVSAPTISRWHINTDGACGMDWNLSLINGTNITENTWKRVSATWFID